MSLDLYAHTNSDEPIRKTGWGLYHHFTIGMACVCSFSQAMAFTNLPFAIPLAICDKSISEKATIWINICFSFGMAIGGLFLTSISDIAGRKFMIPLSLMMIFGSTFACGFANGSTVFLACMFILGSGLITNANCIKIYLAEILPHKKRGFYLAFLDLFWGTGYIMASLIAWFLTPSIVLQQKMIVRLATWRLMFGLSGILSIMVACASALLLPSPRYLLYSKKYPEALATLKHIYAVNNSKHCETYSMHLDDLVGRINDFNLNNEPVPRNYIEQIVASLKKQKRLVALLFKSKFLHITILLIFINFAAIFGLIEINIWLAKALQYTSENQCAFSTADIFHLEENYTICKVPVTKALYKDFFLIAMYIIVGQLIVMLAIDRVGRKICIISGCIACGSASVALGIIHDAYVVKLLISFIFMMTYGIVNSVISIVTIELYPTAFRGTAIGVTQFFAKFLIGIIKFFLNTPCQYSFIFIGIYMIIAAVFCYYLLELRGKPMVE